MSLIKWSDEYLIKIPELDKEHKLLSEMINCLHESMLTDRDSKDVNKFVEKLVSYAEKHFKNEEKLMNGDGFSDAVSHKLSHKKLLRQLKELIKDICPANKSDIARTALLDDWLMDHLLIEDKKYGFYVESEERYRLIVEGVNIIGWEYDPFKDCFTFVSGKVQKMTGFTPQQWYEKGFWKSHIHPEDRDFAVKYCKNATERGEDHEFEYRMVKADGSIVWLRDIVQVVSENGKAVGLRGIFIDITEKKKAEELLKSSCDYLQKLNDSLGDVILTVKFPERIIEYVNRVVERVFGYKPDECVGKKTKMFYPEVEEYHDFGRLLKNTIKEGKKELRVEKLLKRKNGEIFPCEITTTFLEENEKVVQVISILHDITERKQAEKSLLDHKQQMYAFSLATTNMLWNLDLINGTIERNIGFEKAFGYTKKEIVPNFEWWADRLHPDDRERVLSKFENTVKKDDSTCSCEYRFRRSDGNYSHISDTVYIVRDENGKAIRALGAMTDITMRKEAEELLQEQKKALEHKTIALGEVIGQIQLEKQQVKEDVMANVENLLLPVIQKIRLKGESRKYVKLLQKNLQSLTSSFGRKLTKKETKLTPREIEVCNMIKNGLASKEIADLLNLSVRTLETHRMNIRKKLGIANKEVNLASFLNSL